MRSRTLLLAIGVVCFYLLSRSFNILQIPLAPGPGHDLHATVPTLEQLQNRPLIKHQDGLPGGVSMSTGADVPAVQPKELYSNAEIGKITMMYGEPNPTYERALRSHEAHAKAHGYPIYILKEKLLGRLWSKPAYIMSVILEELQKPSDQRLKWLFWFDADTYLINPKIPLDIFLPPSASFSHINFLCGNDHHGLNDGAFLMRVNDWTLHLMAAAISVETFRPEVDLKYSEQSAIEHLVKNEPMYVNKTAIVPQRWYNAFMGPREWDGRIKPNKQILGNSVNEGDLLVHFAGKGETKKMRMTKFMSAYEKNREQWQIELKDTEYPKEIEEFWEDWAKVEAARERSGTVTSANEAAGAHEDMQKAAHEVNHEQTHDVAQKAVDEAPEKPSEEDDGESER